MEIWEKIAKKGWIIPSAYASDSRREEFFWVKLKRVCNYFLHDLSVAGNTNDE